MFRQSTNSADGRMGVGWGRGARDVLQPGLSAGLMADAFCLSVRLSVYNSTTCQILVHTHSRSEGERDRERRRRDEKVAQSRRRLQ